MVKDTPNTPGKKPENSRDPVTISEVVGLLFRAGREGFSAPTAADTSKDQNAADLQVAHTQAILSEEIEKAQAGEDYDPAVIASAKADLIDFMAKRQQLRADAAEPQPDASFASALEEGAAEYRAAIDEILRSAGIEPPEQP
ncbi:MAG TPA: hypothetical protein VN031_01330 [Candidatus Microsaccharimonas sp.]|nr:hypothetical protein [Candidatus Microsaccharimonas sp.]